MLKITWKVSPVNSMSSGQGREEYERKEQDWIHTTGQDNKVGHNHYSAFMIRTNEEV